jgi:hypothetical protein
MIDVQLARMSVGVEGNFGAGQAGRMRAKQIQLRRKRRKWSDVAVTYALLNRCMIPLSRC